MALLVIHCAVLVGLQAADPVDLTPAEQEWIEAHPQIRVGAETDWPPFDFVANDQAVGFANDYLRLLGSKVGIEFEFQHGWPWKDLLAKAKNRELDVLPAIWKNDEREQWFQFSRPYFVGTRAIVVHADDNEIHQLSDLARARIAVVSGYLTTDQLRELLPQATLIEGESPLAALLKVSNGDADAYVGDLPIINYLRKDHLLLDLAIASGVSEGALAQSSPLHIGVRKDWPELVAILDKAMAAVSTTEYLDLKARWLAGPGRTPVGSGFSLSARDRTVLADYGEITIGIPAIDDPWLIDQGPSSSAPTGMAVDLLRELFALVDVSVTARPLPSESQASTALEESGVTMALLGGRREQVSGQVRTESVVDMPMAIAARDDHPVITGLTDLNGKRVAVFGRSGLAARLVPLQASVTIVHRPARQLELLLDGEVDAVIGPHALLAYHRARLGPQRIRIDSPLAESYGFYLITKREHAPLAAILNHALAAQPPAQRSLIMSRWVNQPQAGGMAWRTIVWVVGIAGLLLLLVLGWNRKLQTDLELREQLTTEVKQAEANLTALLEAHREGIWSIDRHYCAVIMNDAFKRILHLYYGRPVLEGENLLDLAEGELRERWQRRYDRALAGESFMVEDPPTPEEGIIYETLFSPINLDGRVVGAACMMRDITARQRVAEDLAAAKEAAEAANQAKTLFLATMSHELRTPLNSIVGFSRRLVAQGAGRNERETKAVNIIHRNGQHLAELINSILDLSKIEAGRMQVEPIWTDVAALVHAVCGSMRELATSKGLTLEALDLPSELVVSVDPLKFRQILTNLLSNAIKYTDAGGVIVRLEESEDTFVIRVADTGIGISVEDQVRLGRKFEQLVSASTRRFGGTGLGLALCFELARLHGGNIEVESEIGVGSTFSLHLPRRAIEAGVDHERESSGDGD